MENKITVERKLTVSDETAKVCRNLLDIHNDNDDRPPRIDGGTVADFVKYLNRELPKWYARQPFDDLMYAVRKVAKDFIEEYGE